VEDVEAEALDGARTKCPSSSTTMGEVARVVEKIVGRSGVTASSTRRECRGGWLNVIAYPAR
jgi:hypothetical protein